ncbi:MAG: hypothetical protein H6767_01250 [Candidatus Peribacteria bacterium]|nr:MAG: hypothetical protein H6767_01250 [Candidatus Peribacteria bacterium]
MIVGVLISMFVVIRIGTYVRSHEKISVITPYSNINKILSIIFAFFIFGKVSIEAFVIAIIAGIIVIVGSIDFKTLQVPKFIKVFAIHQLLTSINILIIGKILEKITFIDYFILSGSTFIITLWIIVFSRKEYIELSRLPRYFYANRLSASFLGMSSDLVGFFLIASIGVVMSILLSFIYIAFILVLSFLFFGDRPSKKNIFLTLILVLLIGC